ncbi:MAG: hypothetical protein ABIF89_01740 [bacterium]
MKKIKTFYLVTVLFISLFIIPTFCAAQIQIMPDPTSLEIDYPTIGGFRPEYTTTSLPEYVKYIFQFAITISGLVILASLVYSGVKMQGSVGSPSGWSEAKDRFFSALIGLGILFSSYIILTTINPQLIRVTIDKIEPPSVDITEGVFLGTGDSDTDTDFPYKIVDNNEDLSTLSPQEMRRLKIVNPSIPEYAYVAIAHTKTTFQGDCEIFAEEGEYDLPSDTRSITVFRKSLTIGWPGSVELCAKYDFIDCEAIPASDDWISLSNDLNKKVNSINIEGSYLVALRGENKCAVFEGDNSNLKKHYLNTCGIPICILGFCLENSCVTSAWVFSLGRSI